MDTCVRRTFRSAAEFRVHGRTTAALHDGIVPITIGSPEGSIANALGGGDLRLVSGSQSPASLSMIAQPRYHSMADLRGAKLGTTSLKEGTCHLMEKMMAAHGMHQPADFQFVMAGAHPQRWEALKAGHGMPQFNLCRSTRLQRNPDFLIWAMWINMFPISYFALFVRG